MCSKLFQTDWMNAFANHEGSYYEVCCFQCGYVHTCTSVEIFRCDGRKQNTKKYVNVKQ